MSAITLHAPAPSKKPPSLNRNNTLFSKNLLTTILYKKAALDVIASGFKTWCGRTEISASAPRANPPHLGVNP